MSARRLHSRARLALAGGVLLAAACVLAAQPQPEPIKKSADSTKSTPKMPSLLRLFDGTFQWPAPPTNANDPERVLISPLELQKLHDQIEQLKKQAAARKATTPSGCALRIGIETRGESTVAVVRAVYTFRTSLPNTVVSLGGKRAFLVSATLDGRRGFLGSALDAIEGKRLVPILDTVDDGFAAMIESAGPHTLVLDLETPVAGRGAKAEIGFELGLPRAAITTLVLDAPNDVRRVNLVMRTPDPTQPAKPAELRRLAAIDVKQLAARPDANSGFPMGPVDSLEVTWDPPAAASQPVDTVLSAEWDVVYKLSERSIELEAKVRPRGNSRTWRFALPVGAELTASRIVREPGTDLGPVLPPTLTRPTDANTPVWQVEIPVGSNVSEWAFTATSRQDRLKSSDPMKPVPIAIGPFTALNVARQTGTMKITALGSVRFEFEASAVLHRTPPVEPLDVGTSELNFQLTSGPTGNAIPVPLLQLKTFPVAGALRVKPTYRLHLTPLACQIEADFLVTPVRTEIESITVEIPASWRSLVAEPAELVEGLMQDEKSDGPRRTATIRLANPQRRPFELKLRANVSLETGDGAMEVSLPRFPSIASRDGKLEVSERDASVTASIGAGWDIRGTGREWESDQPHAWGTPLTATANADGKAGRSVTGRFEHGIARVDLNWRPHRSELTADVQADVTVERRQVRVAQTIRFQGPTALPRSIRLRGPQAIAGFTAEPAMRQDAPGEWVVDVGGELKDGTVRIEFAVPIPKNGIEDRGLWNVSVPLFWPVDVARTQATSRIWSGTTGVQLEQIVSPGWRELPPDLTRQSLPTATLAASEADATLALSLRESDGSERTSVWISRGLIRARSREFGSTDYEARFLIHRWQTDTLELRVPDAVGGEHPEVTIDGVSMDPSFTSDPSGYLIVQIPLPEARHLPLELEVKYRLAPERGIDERFRPPQIRAARFDGPVRWHVILPSGTVPLMTDGGTAVQRWLVRVGLLVPASGRSTEALDAWYQTGKDADDASPGSTNELVIHQLALADVRVASFSRTRLLIACSLVAFAIGFGVSRLRSSLAGPLVAIFCGLAAAVAVSYPQPAAQFIAACEPGFVILVLVLVALAFVRWNSRRRAMHLPGFAKLHIASATGIPAANGTGSVRNVVLGSTGSNGAVSEPHPRAPSVSRPEQ